MRLLIVGAGASIEETQRSGNPKARPFPTIGSFASYWMVTGLSAAVHAACAAYLDSKGIAYNKKVLEFFTGQRNSLAPEDGGNAPLQIFQQATQDNPQDHNIETVCEFVWHTLGKQNAEFWISFAEHTVYLPLFILQSEHFFENGVGWKPLRASQLVAARLSGRDRILSLNYDTVFEIGMKQSGLRLCYAPNNHESDIRVYKPHGSMNLYVNPTKGTFYFTEPDKLGGTYHIPDETGGTFHPAPGIIPPRLNKSYATHPLSACILEDFRSENPDTVTFWGVGLTTSDKDLEEIYVASCKGAKYVEVINPDENAHRRISALTTGTVVWFKTLEEWSNSQ